MVPVVSGLEHPLPAPVWCIGRVAGGRAAEGQPMSEVQLLPNLTRFVPELRKTVMLPGCGHWTQQERPEAVNAEMIEFLRGLA
jgi:pimeloyl-ACP methyl ester carboxylesterase